MVAYLGSIQLGMRINGRALPFATVGPVATLPQHRRKGYVDALVRQALRGMRERGQVWSGVHTPHVPLYRRYGWEVASIARRYSFSPKDTTFKAKPSQAGRMLLVGVDEWERLDQVYRSYVSDRNRFLERTEGWWRLGVFDPPENRALPPDAGLWVDDSGRPQGYVLYHQVSQPGSERLQVFELVALTSDAYLNLLSWTLAHDIQQEIRLELSVEDPFLSVVEDPIKVRTWGEGPGYDLLLRIVDVPAALRTRPCVGHLKEGATLALEVTDPTAPWNEGTWRLVLTEGQIRVEGTKEPADLSVEAHNFAPIFNGFISPTQAALAGLLRVHRGKTLAIADEIFAVKHAPYCSDGF